MGNMQNKSYLRKTSGPPPKSGPTPHFAAAAAAMRH